MARARAATDRSPRRRKQPTTEALAGLNLDFSQSPTVWQFLQDDSFVRGLMGPVGSGKTFGEAFYKASLGASSELPQSGLAFISVREQDKAGVVEVARKLVAAGFTLMATDGTQKAIIGANIACERINKLRQGQPHILDQIKNDLVSLVINTTDGRQTVTDSSYIRQHALRRKIPYTTTLSGANAICEALTHSVTDPVYRLSDIHSETA